MLKYYCPISCYLKRYLVICKLKYSSKGLANKGIHCYWYLSQMLVISQPRVLGLAHVTKVDTAYFTQRNFVKVRPSPCVELTCVYYSGQGGSFLLSWICPSLGVSKFCKESLVVSRVKPRYVARTLCTAAGPSYFFCQDQHYNKLLDRQVHAISVHATSGTDKSGCFGAALDAPVSSLLSNWS